MLKVVLMPECFDGDKVVYSNRAMQICLTSPTWLNKTEPITVSIERGAKEDEGVFVKVL